MNADSVYHEEHVRDEHPYTRARSPRQRRPTDASRAEARPRPRPRAPRAGLRRRGGGNDARDRRPPEPLALVEVASGLASPMQVVAGSEPGVLYVVEQEGTVRVLHGSALDPEPLLDITSEVTAGGEQGCSRSRFTPGSRTTRGSTSTTRTWTATRASSNTARPTGAPSEVRELLAVDQPYENHNGGQLAFGPDGLLYLGLGDGGGAFDPEGRSQDMGTRLGKLLRLDVDATGTHWEIVANGLRNPWRFSFDRETGDLWIGDVGQDCLGGGRLRGRRNRVAAELRLDLRGRRAGRERPAQGRASSSARSPSTPTTSAARSPAVSSTAAPICLREAATSLRRLLPGMI